MAPSPWHLSPSTNFNYSLHFPVCGCWYYVEARKVYLPLVQTNTHVSVLSSASHTTLDQTFTNSSATEAIPRCTYEFPLYDGVSITSFTCSIGAKKLFGVVNERAKATQRFDEAVGRGETAGLLEQDAQASDVFRTVLGNVPPGETIRVRITYVGELKQDAEVDGFRLTIPSIIAPRYGVNTQQPLQQHANLMTQARGMSITVDVNLADGSPVQSIESPSHPISVSIGSISTEQDADPTLTKGSASLSLQETKLDKDFVLLVKAKHADLPQAILERHPTVQDHRALMTTLVPRFSLPLIQPEVVFIADRSGSMRSNMEMLKQAMVVFLRSIPPGVKFNICSYGSRYDFLWERSQPYTKESLEGALDHVQYFQANYGGTETLSALQATIGRRYRDLPLDIVLLTDGDIWDQEVALKSLGATVKESDGQIRVFPLGIGNGVSHALIEGIARAGNGFAQTVQEGERMDNKVVRMLKGALSPHISDYSLEVVFGKEDDFEMVERVSDNLTIHSKHNGGAEGSAITAQASQVPEPPKPPISLFNPSADHFTVPKESPSSGPELPDIPPPNLLQAPSTIPALYPFVRTTVYLLLAPSTLQRNPEAVILRASSKHGPLELRIPVTVMEEPGTTIHCLAARKAVQDLEEGRGWLHEAKDEKGEAFSKTLPSKFQDLVQREAVRLGETFQVANRWCSFVAVQAESEKDARNEKETLEDKVFEESPPAYHSMPKQKVMTSKASGLRPRMAPLHSSGGAGTMRERSLPANAQSAGLPPPAPLRSSMPGMASFAADESEGSQFPVDQIRQLSRKKESAMVPGSSSAQFLSGAPVGGLFSAASGVVGSHPARGGGFGLFRGGGLFGGRSSSSASYTDTATAKAAAAGEADVSVSVSGLPPPQQSSFRGQATVQPTAPSKTLMTDANRVLRIISLQEFDGHWTASADLAALLEVSPATLLGLGDATVTSIVTCFLERRQLGERDVWEMVAMKAQAWLQLNGANVAQLKEEALTVLGLK